MLLLGGGLDPAAVEAHDLEAVVGEAALSALPVLEVGVSSRLMIVEGWRA